MLKLLETMKEKKYIWKIFARKKTITMLVRQTMKIHLNRLECFVFQ